MSTGYHVGWIAQPGEDGGGDILAFNDPLGSTHPRITVQVKRQQQKVAVDGLRAFMALLGTDDVGIFVNTDGFTRDAIDEARSGIKGSECLARGALSGSKDSDPSAGRLGGPLCRSQRL